MERVKAIGYLGLGVSDTAAWEKFANNVLGMTTMSGGKDGTLNIAMDGHDRRFILHPTGEDDVIYVGWEVGGAKELDAMAAQLESAGQDVTAGTPEEAKDRGVDKLIYCADPDGIRTEIYYGAKLNGNGGFKSPRGVSGFVTGDQGLGHILLGTHNPEKKLDFYENILGMLKSDIIHLQMGPDVSVTASFFHCNPRHHTIAILPAPLPKKLHHIMVQVNDINDVGEAIDAAKENGIELASEIGRHTNDHMVSVYMVTPSGFELEYGWGARSIDDSTWQVGEYDSGSTWGHHRLRALA